MIDRLATPDALAEYQRPNEEGPSGKRETGCEDPTVYEVDHRTGVDNRSVHWTSREAFASMRADNDIPSVDAALPSETLPS